MRLVRGRLVTTSPHLFSTPSPTTDHWREDIDQEEVNRRVVSCVHLRERNRLPGELVQDQSSLFVPWVPPGYPSLDRKPGRWVRLKISITARDGRATVGLQRAHRSALKCPMLAVVTVGVPHSNEDRFLSRVAAFGLAGLQFGEQLLQGVRIEGFDEVMIEA